MNLVNKYQGKTVLVTGHMGFKGSWLCSLLLELGAEVIGYGIDNGVNPSLFKLLKLEDEMVSIDGDVRNLDNLKKVVIKNQPDFIFHLAAQPIVSIGYENPVETYETNVLGTLNIMEAVRQLDKKVSFINVTTDKVYENLESGEAFKEEDRLNGYDPYSNSKSCSELISRTYRDCYFAEKEIIMSTMRAGNVIGGGDFQDNRIVPDCARAAMKGRLIEVRNPNSVRPYQHVLEALYGYVYVAAAQYEDRELSGSYNIGPDEENELTTKEVADAFCKYYGEGIRWESKVKAGPREAFLLRLNTEKIKKVFGLRQLLNRDETIKLTADWYRDYKDGQDVREITRTQIRDYLKEAEVGR